MYHGDLPSGLSKPGGVSVHVDRLAEALGRRGHDVAVFTFSNVSRAGYEVRRLRPERVGNSAVGREYIAPWLLNGLPLRGFDVLHLHGDDWFYFRRPLPTVRTFHGSALREAQHAVRLRRRLDKSIVFALELLAARLATGVYSVGPDEARLYRARGLLPLGIDVPATPAERAPRPTVLFIGTWNGRKRGALLHRAFVEVVRRRIPDAELWMVSDYCQPAPGVRWLRWPADDEVASAMAAAWVFCLPSTYEAFGIPYLEALAHGTAVVASPNPGAEQVLERGRYGVLAPDERIGEEIAALLVDPTRRARLETSGRDRASAYSWDRSCAAHEAAYVEAIERWRTRGGARRRCPTAPKW
jgi:glycosyltransferase involved in cell wall biosynthesis